MLGRIVMICFAILLPVATLGITFVTSDPAVPARLTLQSAEARDQDDVAFWLHPTDLSHSTIITSDKSANKIFVYDLDGTTVQAIPARHPGNIDTRYGFRFGTASVDIVAFNERDTNTIRVYKVSPETRQLERIDDGNIVSGPNYGFTLYKNPATGKIYAFASGAASLLPWRHDFVVSQFELVDTGYGRVSAARPLRRIRFGNTVEGMVADDEQGKLYVSEEPVGIWKFDAEPYSPSAGTKIAAVGENRLAADVEGLTLYYLPGGRGYLIASSQGNSRFNVYERKPPHDFRATFTVDGVTHTDGIDVINLPLNANFPGGVFASHNGRSAPHPVQMVRWDDIATRLNLPVDTHYWDPRRVTPSSTPTVVASGTVNASSEKNHGPTGNNIDRAAPTATAALVAAGKVKDDEGRFQVQASCSDNVNAGVTTTAQLNSIPVTDGQAVKLELDGETKIKIKPGSYFKIKAPEFRLVVACRDAAGNVNTAAATPPFATSGRKHSR